MAAVIQRLLNNERGFTLPEMMVSIMIMIVVFFALYGIFDMSLRVFSFGNNKLEATESARVGLEKMEREIRQAYKYNSGSTQNHLFFTAASPTTALAVPPTTRPDLTFGNDLGAPGAADGVITCATPSTCEYITYKLTNANGTASCASAPCTLWRDNGSKSGPVIENVAVNNPADGTANDGLSFTLLKSDGTAPANEGAVGVVLVKLNVVVDQGIGNAGTQTLTTVIDLRNRQ
jgi:prepilin-type N-terminal cleavage/methylation domain-containing protein